MRCSFFSSDNDVVIIRDAVGGAVASWLVRSTPERAVNSSPGRGQCEFLGKTLCSHSASLHPGVQMGTYYLLGKPNKIAGK